ncbi:hypothetical protein AVEN_13572-1 [Araneus ventricosus]|uniref:Uncharacterized protein n=1 Tax=Araneus ventricosus TaxID=182803 RepID=A0A4Y2D5F7_ARAVE|nr:hypothetical protein AVEN_13572-1 [Araneus ventricosus]
MLEEHYFKICISNALVLHSIKLQRRKQTIQEKPDHFLEKLLHKPNDSIKMDAAYTKASSPPLPLAPTLSARLQHQVNQELNRLALSHTPLLLFRFQIPEKRSSPDYKYPSANIRKITFNMIDSY